MNEIDKSFIKGYEALLNEGYCNCNEMNCLDNNSPRRILNIVKRLQQENQQLKKQKDDVVEYIKKNKKVITKYEAKDTRLPIGTFMWNIDEVLRMLGEIDV